MIQPIDNWLTLDEYGMHMPWYVRPCLEWLDKLDLNGKRVFEYGVGKSTQWYASRGADCYGVDSDQYWAFSVQKASESIFYTTDKLFYITEITKHDDNFDIVIVDGIYRDACAAEAINYIKPGGYLIIDNYLQPSVEPNTWDEFHRALDNVIGYKRTLYKEPEHNDWHTLVIQMP